MAPSKNTASNKYFGQQMKDPAFASSYREARAVIDSTDALVRTLDKTRLLAGVSKADLARQIDARPEVVRRLFTRDDANPTLATVLKLVDALGFHLELVPTCRQQNTPGSDAIAINNPSAPITRARQ